eukprot:5937288-Amphidinium_carterae.3
MACGAICSNAYYFNKPCSMQFSIAVVNTLLSDFRWMSYSCVVLFSFMVSILQFSLSTTAMRDSMHSSLRRISCHMAQKLHCTTALLSNTR